LRGKYLDQAVSSIEAFAKAQLGELDRRHGARLESNVS
jgi:hypothetical protein